MSHTSSKTTPTPSQGILHDIWSSVFTPGTNPGLLRATHITFVFLFLSLGFLLVVSDFNGHVLALLGIALGLFGLLMVFVKELDAVAKQGVPPGAILHDATKQE